jgi:hypothetical protein
LFAQILSSNFSNFKLSSSKMHRRKTPQKEDEVPLISRNQKEQSEREELLQLKRPNFLNSSKKAERRDRQARVDAKETTKNLSRFFVISNV